MTENILWKAARRVKGHWHQGGTTDDNGNFCGLGHLDNAQMDCFDDSVPIYRGDNAAAVFMDKVAMEQYPDRLNVKKTVSDGSSYLLRPFAAFNDHPDTNEDEVIAVMEKAAVRLDEQV